MRHCAQHRQASPRRRRARGRLYLTVTSPMARSQQMMPTLRIQTRNLDCSAALVLTTMLMSRGTRCNQKLARNDHQAGKISNLSARMSSETQSDTLRAHCRSHDIPDNTCRTHPRSHNLASMDSRGYLCSGTHWHEVSRIDADADLRTHGLRHNGCSLSRMKWMLGNTACLPKHHSSLL